MVFRGALQVSLLSFHHVEVSATRSHGHPNIAQKEPHERPWLGPRLPRPRTAQEGLRMARQGAEMIP
eukprot:611661-Pyramimonas_sp.AAC.1